MGAVGMGEASLENRFKSQEQWLCWSFAGGKAMTELPLLRAAKGERRHTEVKMGIALKGLLRMMCEAEVFTWQQAAPWEKILLSAPRHLPHHHQEKATQPYLLLGTLGRVRGNPGAHLVLCRMQFGQEQVCICSAFFFPISQAEMAFFVGGGV